MIRVVLVGLGPIGVEIGRAITARRDMTLVGAVDLDPKLAGAALAERVPGAAAIRIEGSLAKALVDVDVVALATSSRFDDITADLETAIDAGVHVASTCEQLAAPSAVPQNRERWAALDARARARGVTVLGTGVNPGFVMDRLVLQLAGACVEVKGVRVERVVDAARRRGPLRKKVGEGLTPVEFAGGVAAGRLGHVGLRESAELIARGLGWSLNGYSESIDPELGADGRCLGIRQIARATAFGEERIRLELAMFVGAPDPHDRIVLDADPPLDVLVRGGTQGDRGTVGTMVNALARLVRAPRGLVTVADVFC